MGSSRKQIALEVARRFAMEFPTEEALKTYVHEHPGADLKNHGSRRTGRRNPRERSRKTSVSQRPMSMQL
jgi:hypothetical protein